VAGIIGGDGLLSKGKYIGIAPKVRFVSVKVTDREGKGLVSDVVAGLSWIYNNRSTYNIKAVNLSLNSTIEESYHTSPLDAALEILWFNKIVVVVAAGNNAGDGKIYPPANDPFVITVGAVDDKGTTFISDDSMAGFSAFGTTTDGFAKPDLVAPGKNIIGPLSSTSAQLAVDHPANKVNDYYFKMSGTSMSAPIVTGAVALMLQVSPSLTPDQVKYRLLSTARKNPTWAGYDAAKAGAGYVDAYAAAKSTSTASANTGIEASQLLWTGSTPITWNSVSWNSVSWNSVSWNSVSWNSVSWNSVSWNSVSWNSDYWGQ
jgi:serine protease AprX